MDGPEQNASLKGKFLAVSGFRDQAAADRAMPAVHLPVLRDGNDPSRNHLDLAALAVRREILAQVLHGFG